MSESDSEGTRQLPRPKLTTLADGTREWRVGAVLHREDGPAVEHPDGSSEWWHRGERHREDGPAAESADGGRFWWRHGNPHREDGPAFEHGDGTRAWYREGKLHREDGPAIERPDGAAEWWLEGERLSEAEHQALAGKPGAAAPMRLWLLSPRRAVLRRKTNPWRPPYDKVFAAVVRAESEQQARALVQAQAGHEGLGIYQAFGMEEEETALRDFGHREKSVQQDQQKNDRHLHGQHREAPREPDRLRSERPEPCIRLYLFESRARFTGRWFHPTRSCPNEVVPARGTGRKPDPPAGDDK